MTPATAKPLPAPLSELLLGQSPGCTWLLARDLRFHAVYGDARRLFGRAAVDLAGVNFIELCEPSGRAAWEERIRRAFAGETDAGVSRFGAGNPAFSITVFPVRSPEGEIVFGGGIAHEIPEYGLVLRTLEALETDRARLARLLHDHVGQSLSAAGLQLDLLRMDLAESAIPIPRGIGEIQAVLEAVMVQLRDVSRELNPAMAERLGLRAALDRLAGHLRADFKGNVRVFADAAAQPAPELAEALYRIAQEGAGQAARRTGCSAIEILLKSLRGGLALEIRDNAPTPAGAEGDSRAGLEWMVMQHFADRAGIELRIEMRAESGTVLHALCRPVTGTGAEGGPEAAS